MTSYTCRDGPEGTLSLAEDVAIGREHYTTCPPLAPFWRMGCVPPGISPGEGGSGRPGEEAGLELRRQGGEVREGPPGAGLAEGLGGGGGGDAHHGHARLAPGDDAEDGVLEDEALG